MRPVSVGALVVLAAGVLTGCVPATRPAQRFAATTSLWDNRVVVTVKNLGPANVWLDPNHCPPAFKVGTLERLPLRSTQPDGRPSIVDVCLTVLHPPELWRVGETKAGLLPVIRLPAGTYTVTAWAELKVAPNTAGKPGPFQTVRVQARAAVLTVP